jgi:hypothetical protein
MDQSLPLPVHPLRPRWRSWLARRLLTWSYRAHLELQKPVIAQVALVAGLDLAGEAGDVGDEGVVDIADGGHVDEVGAVGEAEVDASDCGGAGRLELAES